MDKLTPTLNDGQLKQNIDHMLSSGMSTNDVQSYVNNYSKGNDGNYTLKSQQDGSFLGEEKNNINSIAQSFKDTQSGAITPIEGGVRGVAGGINTVINTPAKHILGAIMTPYNYLASKTPVNSYGYHLLPTADDAARGFQETGIPQAAQKFSEAHPRLSANIGAVKDIAAGTLTAAGVAKGVQALKAPPDINKTLLNTGAAGEADAPGYAKTISERFGVNNLGDEREVAIANNNAKRLIASLNDKASSYLPDPISGELPVQAQSAIQQAQYLESARNAMLNAANVPDATPGLLGTLANKSLGGLWSGAKKVATGAAIAGGALGAAKILGGSPLLEKLNPF